MRFLTQAESGAVTRTDHPLPLGAIQRGRGPKPRPRGANRRAERTAPNRPYGRSDATSGSPASPAAWRSAAALSVFSHVKSWSSRPKWP